MKARVLKELKWLAGWFIVPMLALIGLDLALKESPLPLSERLLTLEDTCSYGMCLILPAFLYLVALGARALKTSFRRSRVARTHTPFEPPPGVS